MVRFEQDVSGDGVFHQLVVLHRNFFKRCRKFLVFWIGQHFDLFIGQVFCTVLDHLLENNRRLTPRDVLDLIRVEICAKARHYLTLRVITEG